MWQNLSERRDRYEQQIRKESIATLLKSKRQQNESCKPSKQLVSIVASGQFDNLIPFLDNVCRTPEIWEPSQQDVLYLNRFLQENQHLNPVLIRCMAYTNCITPCLSRLIVEIWSITEIIDCISHCFQNNSLQFNQYITPELIVNKASQCQSSFRPHYVKTFLNCYSYMHEFLDRMAAFLPSWLTEYDQNLIKLLMCLSQAERLKSTIIMSAHQVIVSLAKHKTQAFELLISLLDTILLGAYPKIIDMILERMDDCAQIRFKAYSGAIIVLKHKEQTEICQKIIQKYPNQNNSLVKAKMLQCIIFMIEEEYVKNYAKKMAELSLDGLCVPHTSFITKTLKAIVKAIERQHYFEIYRELEIPVSHLVNNSVTKPLVETLLNRLGRQ